MRAVLLFAAAAVLFPSVAAAAPQREPDVVVRGTRARLSNWRQAETGHVIVLSDGPESELVRTARNLERLHFLLSGLLGRTDTPDDPIKIRVTLIGDVPEFQAMGLLNRRWQQGPFNELFGLTRYYDPRDDGTVMATTRVDQRTVIERTQLNAVRLQSVLSDPAFAASVNTTGDPSLNAALSSAVVGSLATADMRGAHDLSPTFGENAIDVSADSLLFAGYAQHYLQTYFPAAYPRWYLDGFGQVFASLVVKGDTVLEYGRSPRGTSAVLRAFGSYPIKDVLDEKYLTASPSKTQWTPIHAWMLTHYLMFSDTRRPQLRRYLAARASGADAATAAQAFGDPAALARDLKAYFGSRKPYEVVTYAADRIDQPIVRRLSEGDAAFVKGRLELGARVTIPPPPSPDMPADGAARQNKSRETAIRDRDRWLARLHADAVHWSAEPDAQLLLAEAECRSGHADECLAAAERAAALAPQDAAPLAWKGTALTLSAAALPAAERPARIAAARAAISAANRLDREAVQPFIAYYASFAAAGQVPSVTAVDGLQKALIAAPNAPSTRLSFATALADRGQTEIARPVIMPVAAGPYDSPERPAARALTARIAASVPAPPTRSDQPAP